MSSTSTLRICLAAMAPALTEVTARLKLQDTSVGSESLTHKADNISNESKITVLQRSCQIISGDLNALGSLKRTNGDRPASHLSHTLKRNGTHFDPKRSAAVCDNTRNSHFSCPVGSASTLTNLKALNITAPHIDSCNNRTGDFQGGLSSQANQFIDNLKIMNQPQIATDKTAEQDEVELNPGTVGGGLVTASSCIKFTIKSPVMVNGSHESNRKKDTEEETSCSGTRNVTARTGNQSLEDQRFHFTISSTKKTVNTGAGKMGIIVQNNQASSNSGFDGSLKIDVQTDEKSNDDLRKECGKKQAYLERKVDILLRRLKRMKGKVVEHHSREELKHFVNFQHKNLQKVAKTIKNEAPGPDELKEYFLSNEEVKNMSTAQLVKLVKTYQPNQTAVTNNVSTRLGFTNSSAVVMDPTMRDHSLRTSERLAQRIQTAAAELDSDATASSSGGESGDEDISTFSYHSADVPPLIKRAEWKWSADRAAVVSRWTWLQAQVSDLEYRIRQQSQVHRQLRNTKGGVVLGDQPTTIEILRKLQGIPFKQVENSGNDGKISANGSEVSPCNISTVMSNVDKQTSRLTQSMGNCLSPASSTFGSPAGSSKISSPFVNGLTDSPCSTSTTCETMSESSPMIPAELRLFEKTSDLFEHNVSADATCQAARCRPLRSYRKRKILRTIGLYKTSLKAARLSDVRCRCYPPANPCPICGGRYNNTLTIDPDTMSLKERIAILDPSFHPVLSFPHDIQLSIHLEGLLKSGLWQNKPLPRRSRVKEYRKQKVTTLVTEPVKKSGNNRQNGRNSNSTSVINFSTKIRNKYETKKSKAAGSKGTSVKPCVNKVKKKSAKMAREAVKKNQADEEEEDLDAYLEQEFSMPSGRDNGLTGSASQSSLKDMREIHHRKRKVDNSFDINNIVIPLSMAATIRVEQPQYKEIVTPKWREVSDPSTSPESLECSISKRLEKTNGVTLLTEQQKLNASSEEEVEDLCDEKFAERHIDLEHEEKKRFRNFVQYPPARRNRTRTDVASISSVVSEKLERPDGGEPLPVLSAVAEDSYVSSRPSTPVLNKSLQPSYIQSTTMEDSMDSLQQQLSARRRTMSFSKRERSGSVYEDVHHSLIDVGGVEPWPRRTFPLSEEEYRLMMEDLPPSYEPVHQRVPRRLAEPSGKVYVGGSVENTDDAGAVASPHPSTESVSSAGDDPNDPEWVGGEASKRGRTRRVIHDDPSDPEWTGTDTPRRGKHKR